VVSIDKAYSHNADILDKLQLYGMPLSAHVLW